MVDEMLWSAILLPLIAGVGLSFLAEHLLQPGVRPFWRRPTAAFALHLGFLLLLFAGELLLFRRPWFAMANVLAILLFIILVSNAKFHSLREPFFFQDFEYFSDALKHPRLFIPFLGLEKILLALVAYTTALIAGLTFEPPLTGQLTTANFVVILVSLVFSGIVLIWLGSRKKLAVSFDPAKDLRQLGLLSSLWRYGEKERENISVPVLDNFSKPVLAAPFDLPKLVVVQSESFFDVRRLFSGVRREILQEFDSLKSSSACQGRLTVPAWGANTVRTEFTFLSGLAPEQLGVHRFNPYRRLARQEIPTLAGFLRRLGYRTVCVHPYPASFYSRDKVFSYLGFDEFIDINSFAGVERTGPYVGDIALAEKVGALLRESPQQPIFVFVITMENHGPLHLEKVKEGDVARFYATPPPADCADLTIYLRHLHNADRMAGMVREQLQTLPGPSWLCWFGDHVPIMPKVYALTGEPDGQTDYLLWGKDDFSSEDTPLDIKIEKLAGLLLSKMGLVDDESR